MTEFEKFLNFDLTTEEAIRVGLIASEISIMRISGLDNMMPELVANLIVRVERLEKRGEL